MDPLAFMVRMKENCLLLLQKSTQVQALVKDLQEEVLRKDAKIRMLKARNSAQVQKIARLSQDTQAYSEARDRLDSQVLERKKLEEEAIMASERITCLKMELASSRETAILNKAEIQELRLEMTMAKDRNASLEEQVRGLIDELKASRWETVSLSRRCLALEEDQDKLESGYAELEVAKKTIQELHALSLQAEERHKAEIGSFDQTIVELQDAICDLRLSSEQKEALSDMEKQQYYKAIGQMRAKADAWKQYADGQYAKNEVLEIMYNDTLLQNKVLDNGIDTLMKMYHIPKSRLKACTQEAYLNWGHAYPVSDPAKREHNTKIGALWKNRSPPPIVYLPPSLPKVTFQEKESHSSKTRENGETIVATSAGVTAAPISAVLNSAAPKQAASGKKPLMEKQGSFDDGGTSLWKQRNSDFWGWRQKSLGCNFSVVGMSLDVQESPAWFKNEWRGSNKIRQDLGSNGNEESSSNKNKLLRSDSMKCSSASDNECSSCDLKRSVGFEQRC